MRRAFCASAAAFLVAGPLAGYPWELAAPGLGLCTGYEPEPCAAESLFAGDEGSTPAPLPPRQKKKMSVGAKNDVLIGSVALAVPILGYASWWQGNRSLTGGFHSKNEGFFGKDTYEGGSDKVSHIIVTWLGVDASERVFRAFGNSEEKSRLMAVGLGLYAGLATEIGDGFSEYGFSWQDFACDAVGAFASAAISALHLRDTVGMRFGPIQREAAPMPDPALPGRYSSDYSGEVYTLDLKLAGFLPRVGVQPGLLKYVLFSLSYNTKGFRYKPVEERQQDFGFEFGLNLAQIAYALGLRETNGWNTTLMYFLTYARLPFTSIGYRYDLLHGRWHGPAAGIAF
jgi:uncharacterized protein YfiM (DUF2279 family)